MEEIAKTIVSASTYPPLTLPGKLGRLVPLPSKVVGPAAPPAALPSAPQLEADGTLRGLSEREVLARRAQGLGNDFRVQTSRSYLQIIRYHAFSFINTILFAVGFALVAMGRIDDAILTAGMVVLNVVVGVGQEGRAKHKLDQIALLTRPKATVIRDGESRSVDPREIVVGDVLVLRPGDQIVVDGEVVGDGRMDIDESLLTGESDRVPKKAGDAVYSGSFCVSGSGLYTAGKVGAASLANQITAGARAFRQIKTPLQKDIDFVVRMLVILATQLGFLLALSFVMEPVPVVERLQVAAVILALVPQGLFAMITVTYAMGALRMSGKGALIQQTNAIESLSNVNVLCLDKTGTLTTNQLKLEAIQPIGIEESALASLLGDYVASMSAGNRTAEAIGEACKGETRRVTDEIEFTSALKWSAIAFDDDNLRGTYVLGAPEMVRRSLQPGADFDSQIDEWAERGLRVLLFAYRPEILPLHDDAGEAQLPGDLIPLGLISLRDELRPEAEATLRGFAEAGVQLKIISGDSPQTVAALARQASMSADLQVVSGLELDEMDDEEFARAADEVTIFGRITPQQKERLVRTLRDRGHYVAMIGDGVNDVLSLKQAQLGITMQSGSQATRGVADIVLLNDSFAVLPAALQEGRRIISGMEDVMRLVLTHSFYIGLVILAASIAGMPFPTTPKLRAIVTIITVGVPTLFLAAWARPALPPKSVLRSVMHFVLPAAFSVAAIGVGVYMGYLVQSGDHGLARSSLTTFMTFCGLVLVAFVEPPNRALAGGNDTNGDWRPLVLALILLGVFAAAMFVPFVRDFTGFTPPPALDVVALAATVAVWAIALRLIWRKQIFERLFAR